MRFDSCCQKYYSFDSIDCFDITACVRACEGWLIWIWTMLLYYGIAIVNSCLSSRAPRKWMGNRNWVTPQCMNNGLCNNNWNFLQNEELEIILNPAFVLCIQGNKKNYIKKKEWHLPIVCTNHINNNNSLVASLTKYTIYQSCYLVYNPYSPTPGHNGISARAQTIKKSLRTA